MTSGVSGAIGKGFDSVPEAQTWVDNLILANHPERISALRAEVDNLVVELGVARSRV